MYIVHPVYICKACVLYVFTHVELITMIGTYMYVFGALSFGQHTLKVHMRMVLMLTVHVHILVLINSTIPDRLVTVSVL